MNAVKEAMQELKQQGLYFGDGEPFDCALIVEKLFDQEKISYGTYDLFIHEERSYGPSQGIIQNGAFSFTFIDCSAFHKGNLPKEPEEEVYLSLYTVINNMLKEEVSI